MTHRILVNDVLLDAPVDGASLEVIEHHASGRVHRVCFVRDGRAVDASIVHDGDRCYVVIEGEHFLVSFARTRMGGGTGGSDGKAAGLVRAPMNCKVIAVFVEPGAAVRSGDPVLRVESMKLELNLVAEIDGAVQEILAQPGDALTEGQLVARIG